MPCRKCLAVTWAALCVIVPAALAEEADSSCIRNALAAGPSTKAPVPSPILSTDFSPDGSKLAVGCEDGSVRIWDRSEQRFILTLRPQHMHSVEAVFSPCGRFVIASGSDKRSQHKAELPDIVEQWDWRQQQPMWRFAAFPEINDQRYSPDGKLVAAAGGKPDIGLPATMGYGTVAFLDSNTGKERFRLAGHTDTVTSVAFIADNRVVTSSFDGTLRAWDLTTRRDTIFHNAEEDNIFEHLMEMKRGIYLVAVSGNRDRCAVGGWWMTAEGNRRGLLGIYRAPELKQPRFADHSRPINSILFVNGRVVTAATAFVYSRESRSWRAEGEIAVWQRDGARPESTYTFPKDVVNLSVAADGRTLAAGLGGDAFTKESSELWIWTTKE